MKLKKYIFSICVTVLLGLCIVTTSAHSGRTDSYGGHYDTSTGEYHYHHGYSAHQHYDMDGDGRQDCPYKFENKSNSSNSSSSSNSSNSKPNNNSTTTNKSNSSNISTSRPPKGKITFGKVISTIALMIPFSLLTATLLVFPISIINTIISITMEKCFGIDYNDDIQWRVGCVLFVIGFIILIPLEFCRVLTW